MNTANCNNVVGDLTDVGSYTGSASPNGTFDQGGNVWEWEETIGSVGFPYLRGHRGGSFTDSASHLGPGGHFSSAPIEIEEFGFRVARRTFLARLPSLSPGSLVLLWALLATTGVGLTRLAVRRRSLH